MYSVSTPSGLNVLVHFNGCSFGLTFCDFGLKGGATGQNLGFVFISVNTHQKAFLFGP